MLKLNLNNNSFLKGVTILSSGTIISQIVVVFSSLLLARIYNVSDFGILSLFTSINTILVILFTGRYELAIGLPEKTHEAKKIITWIAVIGFLCSLLYFVALMILKYQMDISYFKNFLSSNIVFLGPIYTFLIVLNSSFLYWCQRNKKYKKIAFSNALQVISNTLFTILLGYMNINNGLVFGLIFGVALSVTFLFFTEFSFSEFSLDKEVLSVAYRFISFPKYSLWSDLSITITQQYIPMIFTFLFSATVVGLYSFSNRMLRLPNIIITNSISNVFRNEAIDTIRTFGECKNLYISTFKKLFFLGLPIYSFLFFCSPFLFNLFFGDKWIDAGYYSKILSVLLFTEFITIPFNTLFHIRNKQKKIMQIQFANFIVGFIMILIGGIHFKNPFWALSLYCLSSSIFNFISLYQSYSLSKMKIGH